MLSLVTGHYPASADQVAVTSGVAATLRLKVGDLWRQGGRARRVTGIVQNPQSLVDEFALVVPGQVAAPSQVTVLFDARGVPPQKIGPNVSTPHPASSGNALNPETIVLALATIGMLLIALVGIGGFTVLAQRRLRSLGLLAAQGATDRNIRLVVRANGVLVGVLGAVAGLVLGLAAWLAYRPSVESDAHHLIGAFQLPWTVIGVAMGLAVIATYIAASRPAWSVTRIPVVTALSGRPGAPQAGPPLGAARPDPARRGGGPVRLFRHEQRERQRSDRTRPRLRRADRGGDPAGPGVPHAAGQSGPSGPDRGPAGPARPGPVPGQVGLRTRRHHARCPDRRADQRAVRTALRQRPRLGRPERGVGPDHRLHAERAGRRRAGQ